MIGPILRALAHRPAAAILIVLEVGFGFAVSVQAFVLGRWFDRIVEAPTGISPETFVIWSESAERQVAASEVEPARARDLEALKAAPGVEAAGPVRRVPLARNIF